ncbi:MAG TPA: PAS domain S-box protein [Lacibacter sp.]|nr:PAS domain S-box protein [Lacibacter sp.]
MDGNYITANPIFHQTFGTTEETLAQHKAIDTIHNDDRDLCSKTCELCLLHPGKSFTVRLRKATGASGFSTICWEFTFLHGNEDAEPCFQCVGYAEAVTKPVKQTVQHHKIADNAESVEAILSNSVDIILLCDENGIITFCSPNIEKEMGYLPSDLIGKSGFEFVHTDDMLAAVKAFADELKNPGDHNSVDIRYKKKDGSWLWAETKGRNLLHHPSVKGIIINLNNISLRKQTEEALQKSENKYRSFFEHLPYPLFLIEQQSGNIINCNKSSLEKYGYEAADMQQLKFADLFEEQTDAALLQDLLNGQQVIVKHHTKNRDVIFVKLEQHNIDVEANGCLLIIAQDVTETYNRQQEGQLAFDISNILMQHTSINEAVTKALQKLRKFTAWDLIELWTPSYDHSFIKNDVSDFYRKHPNAEAIKEFIQQSRAQQYTQSVYGELPAYKTLKPHWIDNLETDTTLVRRQLAINAGFQSVLAVPLLNDGEMVASIYLFSCKKKERNLYAEKLIVTLGTLIGTELRKRKKEQELEQFFNISPDIMTIAGLDGRFLKVNPAFERFIGYTVEEAKELHPLHYVHPDDREAVLEKMQDLSKGISVSYFENKVITRQGDVKWIAWTATPVFEEGMVIATHRDITEQKLFEEKLRVSNERYELATKATANEAIWDLDLKTHEISWSEVFVTLFGYDMVKDDATLGFWEEHIHPEDRERVITSFNEFLQQHENPNWTCEYQFKRADDSYAYIVDRGYMIFDATNTPVRVVGAMEDISDRKELEVEMIVKERIRQKQIAQAAVNAQEKERADIGKELHDNISQMLTSTKLFLDILKNKAPDELLDRSLKNINTIITEIRNISRSLVPSSIEDLGLIASLNDLMDNIRATNIIDVEFYPDEDVEQLINANYKLTLYRIVQEQINNIVKHAAATGVLIELFAEGKNIYLNITDDGKGFDFNTVKKGQGLKNMQSRAELLNGTSDIITAPGKGCKLKVIIPF